MHLWCTQCWLINERSWTWLKETHVVVLVPYGSQHLTQMTTKASQTASQVLMHLLLWTQCKRWPPIRSMGCVHMHWMIPTIEGCDSPCRIRNIAEKNGKHNQNAWKTNSIISKHLPFSLNMIKFEHDGFQISHWRTC